MGFFRRLLDAMLFRPIGGDSGSGATRREFLVTVQGAAVSTYLLPVVAGAAPAAAGGAAPAAAGGAAPVRHVMGRINKFDLGDRYALRWTEYVEGGKPRMMLWTPETRQELADAQRFYDAARGVGPDAPPGRRIRSGSAVERTPEEHRYLAAIRNRPDDPQPYLDYAEWLEARGDSYGSFIRVCVGLEGPNPPGDDDPPQLGWGELIEAHAETWIEPLTSLGFQPQIMGVRHVGHWMTTFGTIQEFDVDRPGVLPENAARFFAALPLVRSLSMWDIENDFGAVCHLPQMAQIEELRAGTTPAQLAVACRSRHLGKLRKLVLGVSSGLGEAGGRALADAPWLHQLDGLTLFRSGLGDGGVRALAESPALSRLKSLDLSNSGASGPGFAALAESPHLAGLEVLNWTGNSVEPDGLRSLRAAKFRGSLRELSLGQCGPKGLSRSALENLAAAVLPRLEVLDLSFARLDGGGMAALVAASWLAGLRELNANATDIGDAEVAELAGLRLPKLERLALSLNLFGDAGYAALAGGPTWPSLKVLGLYLAGWSPDDGPPPGPDAALALAASSRFPNLEELDLHGVAIGPAGAEALARSAGLARLKRLTVTESLVGPVGKAALTRRFGDGLTLW